MPKTFLTFRAAFLFKTPSLAAERLGVVPEDTTFQGTEQDDGFIKTRIERISTDEGFVLMDGFAQEIADRALPLHPKDVDTFCALVTRAARDASTDRDYLLAVAYSLTNNLGAMADDSGQKVGPFRFGEKEWNDAISSDALKGETLVSEDRFRWFRQPIVAATLAAAAVKQFQAAFNNRLPKFKELYFLQRVGNGALDALKTPDKPCKDAIPGNPAAGSYAAELKAGALTVDAALTDLQRNLEKAYVEALKVIDRQPPEIRFFRGSEDDLPWMAVAREQMSAGVSEDAELRNTSQIKDYFTTIGASSGADTPWCGAFVGYCVKQCGVDAVASTVDPNAVSTKFWETWGKEATKPFPIGSVVVLKPATSKGHVGFLAEGSTDAITCLLGGNQGGHGTGPDRVGIVKFPVASNQIIAVRVMTVAAPGDVAGAVAAGPLPAGAATELAWGAKVSADFKQRVIQICNTLGANPNHLMAAMAFETGETFSPSIVNPVSGATGLIQFMPPTARGLGTTVQALAQMTPVEQLDFVLKHFLPQKGRLSTLSDVYMAILLPSAVGKPEDSALFSKPSIEYAQNAGLDKNRDGVVTKAEAASLVDFKLQRGLGSGFKG